MLTQYEVFVVLGSAKRRAKDCSWTWLESDLNSKSLMYERNEKLTFEILILAIKRKKKF